MTPLRKRRSSLLFASLALVVVLLACNIPFSGSVTPPTPSEPIPTTDLDQLPESSPVPASLHSGAAVQLLSAQVGPEGGTLAVSVSGSPLDGFSIVVPPGAYPESVNFEISTAVIETANLQPGLIAFTPLLIIDNGGVEAADFLELHLPLQLAGGKFAMLAIYDADTGVLDPLPLMEEDATHLVAITRHFSRILGVEVNTAELDALNIQTGFRQGRNNWQFANYGSFIAPNGHCAGQSVTMMDFYMRTGGEKLYGLYDDLDNQQGPTPDNQDDDRLAYRLASMVHVGLDLDNLSRLWWYKVQNEGNAYLTYYSLSLALRANNEPQYVSIRSEAGGGHALVLYAKYADRFYVSDPNYPQANAIRVIVFNRSTGKFEPYYSGPDASNLGKPFQNIRYLNKYGMISQVKLNALWEQFTNGTIGLGRFPAYKLYITSPADLVPDPAELTVRDNYTRGVEIELLARSGEQVKLVVYDKDDTNVSDNGTDFTSLPLVDVNSTPYLVVVYGLAPNGKWRWIDGRWFNFMQSFDGSWRGPACGETESNPFRWELNITQGNADTVYGDVYFHACPGGGAVFYSLYGKHVPGEPTVTLTGTKTGGRGDLGANSSDSVTFTLERNGGLSPNFAP